MINHDLVATGTNYALAAKRSYASLKNTTLSILVLIISLFSLCMAQSTSWKSISNFAHEFHLPDTTINTGDTVTLQVKLGTSASPVAYAHAADLTIELSEDAEMPESFEVDLTGSWLFDDSNVQTTTSLNFSERKLLILAERTDNISREGNGLILSIRLVSAEDNVNAQDLIVASGGIILVENVDMRIAPETNADPDEDLSGIAGAGGGDILVENIDMKMSPVFARREPAIRKQLLYRVLADGRWHAMETENAELALKSQPPGLYILISWDDNGNRKVRKVLQR